MSEKRYRADGEVRVNTRLNVRSGSGTNYKIIGKLYNRDKLKIVAKTDDLTFNDDGTMRGGYKIEYKGSHAYVCNNYVTITKEYADGEGGNGGNESLNSSDTYMLVGSGEVVPNINLRVRDIVNLQGLGKNLSGGYYLEEVNFELSDKGIRQTITVSKNAFGASINAPKPGTGNNTGNKPQEVSPTNPQRRTHVLKRGECLWSLAVKYYGNGSKWQHIAKANGIDVNNDYQIRHIPDGKELIIPYI